MTYRKKVINYRGAEPAPTSAHRRIVNICRTAGAAPEWTTVISCDKCQGYFSCVFRGRPCFMPGLIQQYVHPATVRTQGNEINVLLTPDRHYNIAPLATIIEQLIRDRKR